jgi:hypothetical protein
MSRFSLKTITMAAAGATLTGAGITTALATGGSAGHEAATAAGPAYFAQQRPDQSAQSAHEDRLAQAPAKAPEKAKKKIILPSGISTATSFWDAATASGRPMSYHTLASPYWPLGTKVKITYNGKSDIGVVEDFGPAEWAVAQHNPPAIVDLSEEMMQHLTGTRSNSVPVKFEVLSVGDGRVYRHGGTGYGLATKPDSAS